MTQTFLDNVHCYRRTGTPWQLRVLRKYNNPVIICNRELYVVSFQDQNILSQNINIPNSQYYILFNVY